MDDLQRLVADLGQLGATVPDAVAKEIEAGGKRVARSARRLSPRKTGRLARSIKATTSKSRASIRVEVGPTVSYGRFLEYGTAKMEAKPFLGPALDTEQSGIEQRIATEIEKVL